MASIERFGLGTMGMNLGNKESAIKTIHTALDAGGTLSNEDIARMENACKPELFASRGMWNFVFTDGKMTQGYLKKLIFDQTARNFGSN